MLYIRQVLGKQRGKDGSVWDIKELRGKKRGCCCVRRALRWGNWGQISLVYLDYRVRQQESWGQSWEERLGREWERLCSRTRLHASRNGGSQLRGVISVIK